MERVAEGQDLSGRKAAERRMRALREALVVYEADSGANIVNLT